MRLVKIDAPQGKGAFVRQTGFASGIEKVTLHEVESQEANGNSETRDVVEISASTPQAITFTHALLSTEFTNRRI